MKYASQDIKCSGRDWNAESPICKSRTLPVDQPVRCDDDDDDDNNSVCDESRLHEGVYGEWR
jgi:hypothetical protein